MALGNPCFGQLWYLYQISYHASHTKLYQVTDYTLIFKFSRFYYPHAVILKKIYLKIALTSSSSFPLSAIFQHSDSSADRCRKIATNNFPNTRKKFVMFYSRSNRCYFDNCPLTNEDLPVLQQLFNFDNNYSIKRGAIL